MGKIERREQFFCCLRPEGIPNFRAVDGDLSDLPVLAFFIQYVFKVVR